MVHFWDRAAKNSFLLFNNKTLHVYHKIFKKNRFIMKFPECYSCLNILRFFKFSIRNSLQRTGVGYMGGGDEGKKGAGRALCPFWGWWVPIPVYPLVQSKILFWTGGLNTDPLRD